VRNRGILEILEDYVTRDAQAFARADYGFELSGDERRRRFVIQSLLSGEALAFADYTRVMHSTLLDDLPEIVELVDLGLVTQSSESIVLTDAGLERSDAIGPWLYSQNVKTLMDDYSWR
jgi:oxygen-independent coproporphyrinogen-3 oxidase